MGIIFDQLGQNSQSALALPRLAATGLAAVTVGVSAVHCCYRIGGSRINFGKVFAWSFSCEVYFSRMMKRARGATNSAYLFPSRNLFRPMPRTYASPTVTSGIRNFVCEKIFTSAGRFIG